MEKIFKNFFLSTFLFEKSRRNFNDLVYQNKNNQSSQGILLQFQVFSWILLTFHFSLFISPFTTHPSNELVYILSHIVLNQILKVVHNCSLYMHSPNDNFNLMFLKGFSISVDEYLCRSFSHSGCNASLLSRAFQSALCPFASKVFCY